MSVCSKPQGAVLSFEFLVGCRLTWSSVSTGTVGTAGKYSVAMDSGNNLPISFFGTLAFDITASGAGGLDVGAEAASTWYAVHVIGDTNAVNAPVALLSLSATAPTLPAGYDVFRRIGWVRNNSGSNILKFIQTGADRTRRILYDEERTNVNPLVAGNAIVFTTVSLASFVAPTAIEVETTLAYDAQTPSGQAEIRQTGSTVADPATFYRVGIATPVGITGYMRILTNGTQQVDYRVTSVGEGLDIFIIGYHDEI